jgi:hypothetical protein
MAASGFTPISLYNSTTASAVPLSANLTNGELAINIADGKLYYKDNLGVVTLLADKGGIAAGSTSQIQYNVGGALTGTSNFTFDGANVMTVGPARIGTGFIGSTLLGYFALDNVTSGTWNTAVGDRALESTTSGNDNTAVGGRALPANTTGNANTATGYEAMFNNTTGSNNTAVGHSALRNNTTGFENVAIGVSALRSNTIGAQSVAIGYQALFSNTGSGAINTAVGWRSLYANTSGAGNVGVGPFALQLNTTGSNNVGIGNGALQNVTTGSANTAINPINSSFSYAPVFDPTTQSNRFCMGTTSVTNAYIQVAWTVVSDARDKTDFTEVPHGLDFVNKLNPIAYRYKETRDATEGHGPVRYGFKAQEVLALEGDNPVIVDAEDSEKLRFNDQSLLAVLVNAIKELTAEVNNLKAKLPK